MKVPTGPLPQEQQVKVVREYANANYAKDGWDIVSEAFTDQEIIDCIQGAKTAWSAIVKVGKIAKVLAEQRSEIVATAF